MPPLLWEREGRHSLGAALPTGLQGHLACGSSIPFSPYCQSVCGVTPAPGPESSDFKCLRSSGGESGVQCGFVLDFPDSS